jgi:hypothetical protein
MVASSVAFAGLQQSGTGAQVVSHMSTARTLLAESTARSYLSHPAVGIGVGAGLGM